MKTFWNPLIPANVAMLGMAFLSSSAEIKAQKTEVNVRAILRSDGALSAATETAEKMHLKSSGWRSTGFNDMEPPSVDFRGFTISSVLRIEGDPGSKYRIEVARRIARLLHDMGAEGGNLALYLSPDEIELQGEPRLHYSKGNIQGFVLVQMTQSEVGAAVVSIVCYEHMKALTGTGESGGADRPATAPEPKSEGNEKPKPEAEGIDDPTKAQSPFDEPKGDEEPDDYSRLLLTDPTDLRQRDIVIALWYSNEAVTIDQLRVNTGHEFGPVWNQRSPAEILEEQLEFWKKYLAESTRLEKIERSKRRSEKAAPSDGDKPSN